MHITPLHRCLRVTRCPCASSSMDAVRVPCVCTKFVKCIPATHKRKGMAVKVLAPDFYLYQTRCGATFVFAAEYAGTQGCIELTLDFTESTNFNLQGDRPSPLTSPTSSANRKCTATATCLPFTRTVVARLQVAQSVSASGDCLGTCPSRRYSTTSRGGPFVLFVRGKMPRATVAPAVPLMRTCRYPATSHQPHTPAHPQHHMHLPSMCA
jgi:hypothetical protein